MDHLKEDIPAGNADKKWNQGQAQVQSSTAWITLAILGCTLLVTSYP